MSERASEESLARVRLSGGSGYGTFLGILFVEHFCYSIATVLLLQKLLSVITAAAAAAVAAAAVTAILVEWRSFPDKYDKQVSFPSEQSA